MVILLCMFGRRYDSLDKGYQAKASRCMKDVTISRSKSEAFRLFGIKTVSSRFSLAFCGVEFQLNLYPTHSCNSIELQAEELII